MTPGPDDLATDGPGPAGTDHDAPVPAGGIEETLLGGRTVGWAVVHLIEETGRHAGHADILRELVDGAIGR